MVSVAASIFRWCLLLNPTVTGTAFSFSDVDSNNSGVQKDVARTSATKVSGGVLLNSGYANQTQLSGSVLNINKPSDWQMGFTIAGVSDILVLGVTRITGTTETFYGSLFWRETN